MKTQLCYVCEQVIYDDQLQFMMPFTTSSSTLSVTIAIENGLYKTHITAILPDPRNIQPDSQSLQFGEVANSFLVTNTEKTELLLFFSYGEFIL